MKYLSAFLAIILISILTIYCNKSTLYANSNDANCEKKINDELQINKVIKKYFDVELSYDGYARSAKDDLEGNYLYKDIILGEIINYPDVAIISSYSINNICISTNMLECNASISFELLAIKCSKFNKEYSDTSYINEKGELENPIRSYKNIIHTILWDIIIPANKTYSINLKLNKIDNKWLLTNAMDWRGFADGEKSYLLMKKKKNEKIISEIPYKEIQKCLSLSSMQIGAIIDFTLDSALMEIVNEKQ